MIENSCAEINSKTVFSYFSSEDSLLGEARARRAQYWARAFIFHAVGGWELKHINPTDRQVLFMIGDISDISNISSEKTIAIKTEIMDNWNEYWRLSEEIVEGGEEDDSKSSNANDFALIEKSHISKMKNRWFGTWHELLRFVP